MPDIPEAAIDAAADAIMSAGNFNDDEPERFEARTLARAALEAASPLLAEAVEPVTEHANLMTGGGYHLWNTEPYILEIYPLAQKIEHGPERRHPR